MKTIRRFFILYPPLGIKSLDACDPSTLTSKQKKWKRNYLRNIERYENLNKNVVEVMLSSKQSKIHIKSSLRKKYKCEIDKTIITPKSCVGLPSIMLQRSSDVRLSV